MCTERRIRDTQLATSRAKGSVARREFGMAPLARTTGGVSERAPARPRLPAPGIGLTGWQYGLLRSTSLTGFSNMQPHILSASMSVELGWSLEMARGAGRAGSYRPRSLS